MGKYADAYGVALAALNEAARRLKYHPEVHGNYEIYAYFDDVIDDILSKIVQECVDVEKQKSRKPSPTA